MMIKNFIKDDFAKVYKKYTQAGPNYQCFPTTLDFQDEIKQEVIIEKLVGLEENKINLHLFSPFCRDPDCHVTSYQIHMLDDSQWNTYIEYLKNEILIYKKFINKVKIVGIHFSGSEISLIESLKLSQLLSFIATSFEVNLDDVDLSIDINVRLIDIKKLKALKNMGFNRY
jgi:coproporphyrinogen III oxidase-like Fe-S oxidoreductase